MKERQENMSESERGSDTRQSKNEWEKYKNNYLISLFPIMCRCTTGLLQFVDSKKPKEKRDFKIQFIDEIE